MCGGPVLDNVTAVKWGKEREDVAFKKCMAYAIDNHRNCKLHKTGLFILPDKGYVGASPDGLIPCSY